MNGSRAKRGEGGIQKVKVRGIERGYRAYISQNGKRVYGPLVQDESEARSALLKKLLSETGPQEGMPLSTSVRALLDGRLKKEWAPSTLELAEALYPQLGGLGAKDPKDITALEIVGWRVSLDVAPSTAHRYQRLLEVWLKMLGNPVKGEKPRVREPDVRVLSRTEQAKLVETAREGRRRNIIRFMLEVGCRPGELCGLRYEDIVENGAVIQRQADKRGDVKIPKTDRSRRLVPVSPELLDGKVY